jgi:hypothetical protein
MDAQQAVKEFEQGHKSAIERVGSDTYPQITEYHYAGFDRGLYWVDYTVDTGRGFEVKSSGY